MEENIIIEKLVDKSIENIESKDNSISSSDKDADISKSNSINNEIIISSLDGSDNNSATNSDNSGNINNDKDAIDNLQHTHKNEKNNKNESIIKYINNTITCWDKPNDNISNVNNNSNSNNNNNDISNPIDNKSANTLENILDITNAINIQSTVLSMPKPSSILSHQSLNIQNYNNNDNNNNNDNTNKSLTINIKDNKDIQNIQDIQHTIIKPSVVFASSDCNKVSSFDYNSNSNSQKSFKSKSEISYELFNKIQNDEIENNNIQHKNIRISKTKNKQQELDETDFLYNKLQDFIRNININRSNYIIIIVKAIEIIENYNGVHSINDKKKIVIKAFNRLTLIDLNLSENDQSLFLSSISNIIEIIIACSKNKNNNNNHHNHHNHKKHFLKDNQNIDDNYLANLGQITFSLIDKITTIIVKKQYNADKLFINIGTITNIIMNLVDKYLYLTGTEKKIIVLHVIEKLFKERIQYIIEITEEKKENLIMAIDKVPILIDILISVQKGKYKINRKQLMVSKKSFFDYIFCRKSKSNLI